MGRLIEEKHIPGAKAQFCGYGNAKAEALAYLEATATATADSLREWKTEKQEQVQQQQPIQWSIRYAQDDESRGGAEESGRALLDTPPFRKERERVGHPELL